MDKAFRCIDNVSDNFWLANNHSDGIRIKFRFSDKALDKFFLALNNTKVDIDL